MVITITPVERSSGQPIIGRKDFLHQLSSNSDAVLYDVNWYDSSIHLIVKTCFLSGLISSSG